MTGPQGLQVMLVGGIAATLSAKWLLAGGADRAGHERVKALIEERRRGIRQAPAAYSGVLEAYLDDLFCHLTYRCRKADRTAASLPATECAFAVVTLRKMVRHDPLVAVRLLEGLRLAGFEVPREAPTND